MVARLTVADATVGELAAPYDVSVQAVSKHLRVLEDAGLVSPVGTRVHDHGTTGLSRTGSGGSSSRSNR